MQIYKGDGWKYHIRWMVRRDMAEVLYTESNSFEFPWREEDFIRCLRQRNCIGMVCEAYKPVNGPVAPDFLAPGHADPPVVGFMIYELHKKRLHLLNFAVHPDWRRQDVGRTMVHKLANKLSGQCRTHILTEIRETNLDAQRFFKKMGFKAVAVLHNFYDEPADEDAYLMRFDTPHVVEPRWAGRNRITEFLPAI